MNREQRLFLMVGVPIVAVAVIGYLVVDTAGGSFGSGTGMDGEWEVTVGLEERRYSLPEDQITLNLDLFQDESGYLAGTGYAEYDGREWDVTVNSGQGSWVREEDGRMNMSVSGDGEDFDDHFRFFLDGEVSGGAEGTAEGMLYFDSETEDGQDFSGTALPTAFVAERS